MKNLVGNSYGRLKVLSYSHRNPKNRMAHYVCECSCGKSKVVSHGNLRSGHTTSCGCFAREKASVTSKTHGMSKTKEFKALAHIKDRCNNPNSQDYSSYGGKGLIVDPSFMESFENFYNHIGPAPTDVKVSVDRIDRNLGYIIGNIRWATDSQQAQNKGKQRNNTSGVSCIQFYHSGKPTHSTYAVATWSKNGTFNKKFNCKKLGLFPAFKLAFEYRNRMILELNNSGENYSPTHGL